MWLAAMATTATAITTTIRCAGAWSPMRADSRYHGFWARVLRWSKRPGVSDVTVRGQTNVTTDAAGYAVVPYVRPYHRNSPGAG